MILRLKGVSKSQGNTSSTKDSFVYLDIVYFVTSALKACSG